jgi:hypothetical protein
VLALPGIRLGSDLATTYDPIRRSHGAAHLRDGERTEEEPVALRVCFDAGAHVGETLEPALDQRYRFDRVVCFERVEACCAVLERLRIHESRAVSLACRTKAFEPRSMALARLAQRSSERTSKRAQSRW